MDTGNKSYEREEKIIANKTKQLIKKWTRCSELSKPRALTIVQTARNIGIGEGNLTRWNGEMKRNPEKSFKGSGNNSSDEGKKLYVWSENWKIQRMLLKYKKVISILGE